jgi:hypothetical protein
MMKAGKGWGGAFAWFDGNVILSASEESVVSVNRSFTAFRMTSDAVPW